MISGKYRLEEVLGRGGFGIVFRATHLEMDRSVALKTLLPQSLGDVAAADRFRREAVLASSLTHPNSITLFDYGQTEDGLLYLVMELLRGQTLKHYMREAGAVEAGRARNITVQVLKSLSEAHDLGIVHLDLKPENIFLCDVPGEQDFVKVLDFGVARMLADANVKEDLSASLAFGTPKYMSPEQITGEPVGPSTDIYSLGLIAWEMLMGEPAFHGRTPLEIVAKQVNNAVPDLPDAFAATPLGRVVSRAISKRPEDRFAKASEALDLLQTETPMSIDAGWLDDDLLGGGDLADGFLPVEGWPSVENLDPAEPSGLLAETSGEVEEELENERTTVVPRDYSPQSYLEEGVLDDLNEDPMNADPTVVAGGHFEDSPTEAIMLLRDADVEVVTEDEEFESETTTLYTGGRLGMSGEFSSTRNPRHYEAISTNHTGSSPDDGTDPHALDAAVPDPSPGGARNVLFSVGQEAGYIGSAHNVPGVHIPPEADLASQDREERHKNGVVGPAASGYQPHPVRVIQATGQHQAVYPPPQGVDRGIVLALSLLGLGLMAILTLVIVVLMLPILRGQSSLTTAQPVPAQPSVTAQPLPQRPDPTPSTPAVAAAPARSADVGTPDAAVVAALPSPDAGALPDVPVPPKMWKVTLTSKPVGAEVVIGDEILGKTPLELERNAEKGTLEGVLRLEGYDEKEFKEEYSEDGKKFELAMTRKRRPVALANTSGRATPRSGKATKSSKSAGKGSKVIKGRTGNPKTKTKTKAKSSSSRPPMGKGKSKGKNPWGKW